MGRCIRPQPCCPLARMSVGWLLLAGESGGFLRRRKSRPRRTPGARVRSTALELHRGTHGMRASRRSERDANMMPRTTPNVKPPHTSFRKPITVAVATSFVHRYVDSVALEELLAPSNLIWGNGIERVCRRRAGSVRIRKPTISHRRRLVDVHNYRPVDRRVCWCCLKIDPPDDG